MDKIFNFLGWLVFMMMLLSLITWYGIVKIDQTNQQKIIMDYELQPEKYQSDFFGYILFPDYQQSRIIMYGNPSESVKKFQIGILGTPPINFPNDSLILVGHSRKNQFAVLHQLKHNDKIKIIHQSVSYLYQVKKIEVISENDSSFLKKIEKNMLVLITCMDDDKKRLIVYCQK